MSKIKSRKKINLSKDFSYPDPNDPELLSKIFKKREFFYHKVPERKKLETYEEVQKYREQNCKEGTNLDQLPSYVQKTVAAVKQLFLDIEVEIARLKAL
jgi:hypothetical protein